MPETTDICVGRRDTYHFVVGDTFVMTNSGRWRRVAGLFGLWWLASQRLHWLTRWWRPRTVCSAVDQDAGVVTLAEERWSWRRWRWERS